jgi:hypothetical protein
MSTFADIITQINSYTGYRIPSASGYIVSTSVYAGTGSVNDMVNQINQLTGYNLPAVSASYVSGITYGQPIILYTNTAPTGTISTEGIYPGGVIKAEQVLRIINALNGIAQNDIIISGSLILPQIPNEDLLESISGSIEGTNVVDGGSF